ncbi:MAG: hypothetical protein QOD86_352, partial [Miltoncostaeaceae bacterium]|nr:hypothetical protein [Miltoncostaeaceae bacterium]
GAIVLGPVHAWSELRRLRKGLEAAGTGPLPLIEGPREDGARSSARSLRDVAGTILVILLVAAFVGYVVFWDEETFPILMGGVVALPAGEAIVLVWLRRRRARDGMQIYVRDVEGDEETADPPRLHLVPRGS